MKFCRDPQVVSKSGKITFTFNGHRMPVGLKSSILLYTWVICAESAGQSD